MTVYKRESLYCVATDDCKLGTLEHAHAIPITTEISTEKVLK